MKESTKQNIISFAKALEEHGIPFEKLFVYGSVARGTDHGWSDIDIAVVGAAFGADHLDELSFLSNIAKAIDPALSPFPLRPEDLHNRFSVIGDAIRREGIEIPT